MSKKSITVNQLIKICEEEYNIKFKLAAGEKGIENRIETSLINRPGITLTGYFKNFASNRIQIFGKGEFSYISDASNSQIVPILEKFFSFKIPCCIFTFNAHPNKKFCEIAEKYNVPLLISKLTTTELINKLNDILGIYLAPEISLHGVLVEVYGVGVLILGESGIGKSETALELVSRGHRLVADDVIIIKKISSSTLIGTGNKIVQHFTEVRGLGILDVKSLFGLGSIRESKRVDIVVLLEEWKSEKEYDRLGLKEKHYPILGVKLPLYVIPVRPGRNIPVLVEIAAKNTRLKKMKIYPEEEIKKKLFKLSK